MFKSFMCTLFDMIINLFNLNDPIKKIFAFDKKKYKISSANSADDMYAMYVQSSGLQDLFELPDGSIWYLTIHLDRYSKLEELQEFSAPSEIHFKPDGKYLWSSSMHERGYNWLQFIINELQYSWLAGNSHIVATRLNHPNTPICWIDTSEKLLEFDRLFSIDGGIDWPRFYKHFGSLIIFEYFWEHRLSMYWFYGYDCNTVLNLKRDSTTGDRIVMIKKINVSESDTLYYEYLISHNSLNNKLLCKFRKFREIVHDSRHSRHLNDLNSLHIFAFLYLRSNIKGCRYTTSAKKLDDILRLIQTNSDDVYVDFWEASAKYRNLENAQLWEFGNKRPKINMTKISKAVNILAAIHGKLNFNFIIKMKKYLH